MLSLYINPKVSKDLPELQDLINLTKTNILKQQDNILAIFHRRKNYLLKKHLQNREFKGNIFFEKGSLVKKIQNSVKDLAFPSTDIFSVESVAKPFCLKCQHSPERCKKCKLVPPTHLQLRNVASNSCILVLSTLLPD